MKINGIDVGDIANNPVQALNHLAKINPPASAVIAIVESTYGVKWNYSTKQFEKQQVKNNVCENR